MTSLCCSPVITLTQLPSVPAATLSAPLATFQDSVSATSLFSWKAVGVYCTSNSESRSLGLATIISPEDKLSLAAGRLLLCGTVYAKIVSGFLPLLSIHGGSPTL